jgi:hypothetical protein
LYSNVEFRQKEAYMDPWMNPSEAAGTPVSASPNSIQQDFSVVKGRELDYERNSCPCGKYISSLIQL